MRKKDFSNNVVVLRARMLNAQARCAIDALNDGCPEVAQDIAFKYKQFDDYFRSHTDWLSWKCDDFESFVKKSYSVVDLKV